MNILVLNCGSSSLKFQIITTTAAGGDEPVPAQLLVKGLVERIGGQALISIELSDGSVKKEAVALRDHKSALEYILGKLLFGSIKVPGVDSLAGIQALGHRVVHGAEKFSESVLIDATVIKGIEDCIELAPLHNLANIKGILAAAEIFGPDIPQVAVFDTAFHATMPEVNYLYAIPYQLYRRHRIRRYGFHGTSHRYVSQRFAQMSGLPTSQVTIITLHLGNGCSACAIRHGRSLNTSMGFTPLAGLMMGTRSGDIDPAIVEYLAHKEGYSPADIDVLLNKQAGLLGISGLTNDMRDLLDEEAINQDRRAHLAIEMFCLRVKQYMGAYMAELNGVEAIVFTGGIGENAAEVRKRICSGLDFFGIHVDDERNNATIQGKEGLVSRDDSVIKLWVIPTNEELLIAQDTAACIEKTRAASVHDKVAKDAALATNYPPKS